MDHLLLTADYVGWDRNQRKRMTKALLKERIFSIKVLFNIELSKVSISYDLHKAL
jgi:hypothetical protein